MSKNSISGHGDNESKEVHLKIAASAACPLPRHDYPNIILGHGGGGQLSAELLQQVFLPAFGNSVLSQLGDSAVVSVEGSRLAFTTDSFVVQPLFFPGGSIGDLAVNGTVNDLAMSGARALFLTAGFIVEEGFPLEQLQRIVKAMAEAAKAAGVQIVAGDTKVVERGHGDGCYINTSGVGLLPEDIEISPRQVRVGDRILLSGSIGDHGMAIMSVREGLAFETEIQSDTVALNGLVEAMLAACPAIRFLRDPTRGGLAATLNEIAGLSSCGVEIQEAALPVKPEVGAACEFLGLDPLHVANEGKLVCVVPADSAETVLEAMRGHALGREAVQIGEIVASHPQMVVAETTLGATRIVSLPIGEQLPRIC